MRFALSALAAAACLMSVAAQAAWHEASSEHFVIYANDSERDISRFAQQLERYHAGMALVLGSKAPVPSPSNRVTVFVVKNEREVRALYDGDNKYVAGFYVPRAGGSVAIVPAVRGDGGKVTWSMIVLLHEYAHHFLISTNSAATPRWFSEGAAEFFSSSKFEDDGGLWLGRPANHRAGELFHERDVDVADLLDPTEYDKRKSGGYDAFYGKSWLLYHYLTFGKTRDGQLTRYLNLLRGGKSQRDAALEAFGDFKVLEKELDAYLVKSRMSALKLKPEMLKIGPIRIRPVTPGEAAMMPVRIRSRRGVSREEAATLVTEARAIAASHPGDPAVLSALAESEFDAGNDAAAIAAADAAIKADPGEANAYVQKGYALFRIAEAAKDKAAAYKAARAPFIALNRLENDHPLPLIYFHRSFVEQGVEPTPTALDGLIRAMEVAPFDSALRLNLGHALILKGRQPEARIVLSPVAFNPHGGSMSDYARAMIDRLEKEPGWKGEGGLPAFSEAENAKE